MAGKNKIVFDTWADTWQQGCLLGNGFMGQVIYGRPGEEIVDLSHIAFFSGSGNVDPYPEKGVEAFARARQAALEGDYEEVYRQTGKLMGKRGNYGTNLPVGKLRIKMEEHQSVSDYRRFLNLDEGIAGCSYRFKDCCHKREAFTSHEDYLFVYYMEQTEVPMAFTVSFDGGRNPFRTWVEEGVLCFQTRALETVHSDGTEGMWLCGAVKVCEEECCGEVAKRAVIYLAMDVWNDEKSGEKKLEGVKALVNRGLGDYIRLRERHSLDVGSLMGRQRLELGAWKETEPTTHHGEVVEKEENLCAGGMLERVRQGGDNRRLTELMYQYGRYLLLSASRQDSPLPTHLQGVWNDDVACQIGWTCDMHLDINTQMNYWISEPGNLGECHEPLFNWMEQCLIPNGRLTAQKCYGYPGWVGELVSNAWGYAAPYWNESLSPCPTGGIWQASDYLEHYRYGQDKAFLEKRALPVIGEAVLFFLNYLFEDGQGHLVGGPSISPENAFLVDGKKYFASVGCTYEMAMVRELFLQYVELCRELGIEREHGCVGKQGLNWGEILSQVEAALPGLLPYRILPDGTLAEWNHDYESADSQHRHTSHLLGLFPYSQITPEGTPDLAKAAAASIKAKLTPYENWEDTGWARSLLTLYSARLGDADQAYRHLLSMQTILTGSNLLVMHPPTRGAGSFMEVYELDGNTGFSMAVLEMLVQSHEGCIRLLPALPEMWADGKLEGVILRGGITLDLYWEQGRPASIIAISKTDADVVFAWKNKKWEHHLPAGKRCQVCCQAFLKMSQNK